MSDKHRDDLSVFRGRGVVYLSFDVEGDGCYSGYWDRGQPNPAALQDFPRSPSAREAVAWGRERTPRVLIRPRYDTGHTYWAGIDEPTGEFAGLPVWDPAADIP